MNKQELIDKYEDKLKDVQLKFGANFKTKVYEELLEDLKQLDEPQKSVVPQFVADWIEECKDDDFHLFGAMEGISSNQKKLDYWFREDDNMELFVRAWLDGYEVEEEKRYFVRVKGVYFNNCLIFEKRNKTWFFSSIYEIDHQRGHHTRKELEEAGFGWVFDCPEMEVKEVEG